MKTPIRYVVSVPDPDHHLLAVRIEIPEVAQKSELELHLPVWSPGSYKVREYSRHLRNFRAQGEDEEPRSFEKADKATWRVDCSGTERLIVHYEIYAHTLNVREKHVDDTHAFFQPTAVYMYPDGELGTPAKLQVNAPRPDWKVYCGLDRIDGTENRWRAPDLDALYDAPVEMGDHDEVTFEADGVEHTMAFWGEGNWDRRRLERDLPEIVEANASFFDGVPYDDYTFITLLSDGLYGGLEHRNSTSLLYPQNQFGEPPEERDDEPPVDDDDYLNFLSLVAHEHFHVWNVKRIFPAAIEQFDYQSENYVPDLWTIEGITSYYDRKSLLRAGVVDADGYLDFFARRIRRLESTPGRKLDSLRDAGMDAWVKLYLSGEHTRNSTVSYYLKGSLVALMLDLRIRLETDGDRSLDDVLAHLWETFGREHEQGYPDGYYEDICSEMAGTDLTEFFDRYVRGTDEIDWEATLEPFGLTVERSLDEDSPAAWLGLRSKSSGKTAEIRDVRSDGPAYDAGLYPGDAITAVGGWRVTSPEELDERLELFAPGDEVEVHLFRRNRLVTETVELGERPADEYALVRRPDADAAQLDRLTSWLEVDDAEEITPRDAS